MTLMGRTSCLCPSKQEPLLETFKELAASLDLDGLKAATSRLARAADDDPAVSCRDSQGKWWRRSARRF